VLKYVQLSALRRADVAVFLTKYARDLIQRETGHLEKVRIIGHGINEVDHCGNTLDESHRPPKVVYVSNIAPYKNHDYVLDALAELRRHGLEIQLTLIGGGADGPYLRKTLGKIANLRREGYRIETLPKLAREEVIGIVKNSDVFLFASSCESMPVTLLEGMKLGIPVACSNQGPMPEILREGGWYFHPKMPGDIARTVREILLSSREERDRRKGIATAIANGYTWHNTARKTWSLVFETLQSKKP
jgi:glycosyltransferase involved in cell wall biosynthesis